MSTRTTAPAARPWEASQAGGGVTLSGVSRTFAATRRGGELVAAWTVPGDSARVQLARYRLESLP